MTEGNSKAMNNQQSDLDRDNAQRIKFCAVTGKKIEPGDMIVTTTDGYMYALKSYLNQTAEEREELEGRLFGFVPVEPDVFPAYSSPDDVSFSESKGKSSRRKIVEPGVYNSDIDAPDVPSLKSDDDSLPGSYSNS